MSVGGDTWAEVQSAVSAGAKVVGFIIDLIKRAMDGDKEAVAKLKRVEDVLSPTSPTEGWLEDVARIAANKPEQP